MESDRRGTSRHPTTELTKKIEQHEQQAANLTEMLQDGGGVYMVQKQPAGKFHRLKSRINANN